jgi:excisionase family DNA binding protein
MTTSLARGPIPAAENDQINIKHIEQLLEALQESGSARPKLVGPEGQEIELPESIFQALRVVAHDLARNRSVNIVAVNQDLTTQEAADLLNVSRPFLIKLLEEGEMPYFMVGAHRRVHLTDLLEYKQRRNIAERAALAELTRLGQEMGLYDE